MGGGGVAWAAGIERRQGWSGRQQGSGGGGGGGGGGVVHHSTHSADLPATPAMHPLMIEHALRPWERRSSESGPLRT